MRSGNSQGPCVSTKAAARREAPALLRTICLRWPADQRGFTRHLFGYRLEFHLQHGSDAVIQVHRVMLLRPLT